MMLTLKILSGNTLKGSWKRFNMKEKLKGLKGSFTFSPCSWYDGGGEDYYRALEFFEGGGGGFT